VSCGARIVDQSARGDSPQNGRSDCETLPSMLAWVALLEAVVIGALVSALVRTRSSLVLEALVLRQQLAVLHRAHPHPRLRALDRAFWVVVSPLWSRWADALVIVKPATVLAWHRRGFALFWTF
jgi:hypothetical protein